MEEGKAFLIPHSSENINENNIELNKGKRNTFMQPQTLYQSWEEHLPYIRQSVSKTNKFQISHLKKIEKGYTKTNNKLMKKLSISPINKKLK